MRIQITAGGIYDGAGKEIPVGTELTVKEEPKAWAGRYTVLSGGKSDEDKVAVANPAGADREDLKKQADELGLEYARNITTEKLSELIDAKLAE